MNSGNSTNRLIVSGRVSRQPESRQSPAGVTITRFTLEHQSQQHEDGLPREASFRIEVVCTGKALAAQARSLTMAQPVEVEGFITRENYRDADRKLALHAQQINLMDE